MEIIRREVAACTRCAELASSRTQTVFGVGNPNARICFFGEAPGADEDRLGEPFVGRAGQLLTKMIEACGLKREEVYILNVLKCRPPENRNPLPDEVANCRGYFERQLDNHPAGSHLLLRSRRGEVAVVHRAVDRQAARQVSRLSRHSGGLHVSSGVFAAQSAGEGRCLGRSEDDDAAIGGGTVGRKANSKRTVLIRNGVARS